MKVEIPNLLRPILLSEFAPELEVKMWVWVNPNRDLLDEHQQMSVDMARIYQDIQQATPETVASLNAQLDAVGIRLADWYAKLWSQHPDTATHWSLSDALKVKNDEANPALWRFLTGRSMELILAYRVDAKKK